MEEEHFLAFYNTSHVSFFLPFDIFYSIPNRPDTLFYSTLDNDQIKRLECPNCDN